MRFPILLSVVTVVSLAALHAPPSARAEEPDETKTNACGCHKTPGGMCYCERKAKCGCPGECEPKGCEEKRAKELEKQIREETRKAEQAGRAKEPRPEGEGAVPAKVTAAAHEEKEAAREKPAKPAKPKLSAAQRKELARLLEAYLADHPEASQRTLEQARRELTP